MELFKDIGKLITENNLYATAIAMLFTSFITELVYSVADNLIIPFIDFDINKNKKNDLKELKQVQMKIFGVKLNIGRFLFSLVRFIIMIFILLFINKLNIKKQ
jgi:large-conductance mechanosensitive channel